MYIYTYIYIYIYIHIYINFYVMYKNVKTYIKNKTFILCELYLSLDLVCVFYK